MKKILVFIDTSLGELDWISPFLTSKDAQFFEITILFRKNILNRQLIEDYSLDVDNIIPLNANDVFFDNKLIDTFWRFSKSLQKRSNKFPEIYNYINHFRTYLTKKIKTKIDISNKFDFIFRDFGLGNSKELLTLLNFNKNAKIIVYPHGIGIWPLDELRMNNIRNTKIDLYLSNTSLSPKAFEDDRFFISGVPAVDEITRDDARGFDYNSSNILILTRDYYEINGCTRTEALKKFEELLSFCSQNNLNVLTKHHPRDKKTYEYREIQEKFSNVKEYTHSLINLDMNFRACLSFYSTAGIFLTARHIPVFDITPYENCKNATLLDHYCGDDGFYTHDLIEFGLQDKIQSLNILMDKKTLNNYSNSQFNALKTYFPLNANQKIFEKLLEL